MNLNKEFHLICVLSIDGSDNALSWLLLKQEFEHN